MFNQCDLAVLFPVLFMYKNKEESGSAVLKLVGPFVDLKGQLRKRVIPFVIFFQLEILLSFMKEVTNWDLLCSRLVPLFTLSVRWLR